MPVSRVNTEGPTVRWDDGKAELYPSLTQDLVVDFCVIGLGGSGLSAINRLLDTGASVIGLDSHRVASGAAGRNGGFLLAGMADAYHEALDVWGADRARHVYAATQLEIARMATDVPGVRVIGNVRLADDDDEYEDCLLHAEALANDGFNVTTYEDHLGRGILTPDDAVFDPVRRCRAEAARAVTRGARLFEDSAAIEITATRVEAVTGSVACGAVLVCVDGNLEHAVPGMTRRVRSARLQMAATTPTTEIALDHSYYYRDHFDYWHQLTTGEVMIGGCRDYAMDVEWGQPAVPSDDIQQLIDRLLRNRLGVHASVSHRWAGVVGFTPDYKPICEQLPSNIWVAGGYSSLGNVMGPLCGRAIAERSLGLDSELFELLGSN